MVLVSTAFAPGGELQLGRSHVPAGTRAFAIVLDDPDTNPGGAPLRGHVRGSALLVGRFRSG